MKIQAFSWRPWRGHGQAWWAFCAAAPCKRKKRSPLGSVACLVLSTRQHGPSEPASVTAGAQTESRWAHHGEPLSSFWFGAQWRPELKGKGGRSSGRNDWSFGAKNHIGRPSLRLEARTSHPSRSPGHPAQPTMARRRRHWVGGVTLGSRRPAVVMGRPVWDRGATTPCRPDRGT